MTSTLLTEVHIREVGSVGVLAGERAVGEAFTGAAVHGTGSGYGLHQVLIICVPPAPPAYFRLTAASNHCPCALVPGGKMVT